MIHLSHARGMESERVFAIIGEAGGLGAGSHGTYGFLQALDTRLGFQIAFPSQKKPVALIAPRIPAGD